MISTAILAGGKSERMGQDKALMPFLGHPLILRLVERLQPLADEIFVVTDRPEDYAFLGLPLFQDLEPGRGPLGGLYTALHAAKSSLVAAVACDLPFANLALFEYERDLIIKEGTDVAIPSTPKGLEPLHAIYRRETCLAVVRSALEAGEWKLSAWLPKVMVSTLSPEETKKLNPRNLAFWNLNTPQEFRRAEACARLDASL
jgi:molybdopterin-guanine dinucleotide biosynthesis protein A